MKRHQTWQPDTHPEYLFTCEWDTDDPDAPHVCIAAMQDGVFLKNPQAVYDAVLNENQAKNIAVDVMIKALPEEYTKPLVDSDGDVVADEKGAFVRVMKDKYPIEMEPTPLGEPTILKIAAMDPSLAASMDAITPAEVSVRGA
tara:strand:+ start:314 stop:742 length:429 start_codon:yes stop_codon:yes gene_type:complete